jgi:CheY-like chemotaxis protein
MALAKVLVADDSPEITSVIDAVLRKEGRFELYYAANGEDALSMARRHLPDVMLLDIMMPRVHGLKVCKTLKEDPTTQDIRIIMASALGREYTKREAYSYGANGFITKPFSPRDLVTAIDDTLKERKAPVGGPRSAQSQMFVFNRGDEVRVYLSADYPDVGGIIKTRIPPGQWEENDWGYKVGLDTGGEVVVKWDRVAASGGVYERAAG